MSELDPEEAEILEAFESGKIKRVKNGEALLAKHKEYAATFRKEEAASDELHRGRPIEGS